MANVSKDPKYFDFQIFDHLAISLGMANVSKIRKI